jgi:arylsulfatase
MNTISKFLIPTILLSSCSLIKSKEPEKPNIIFIMVDDFGYSQIAYNSEKITADDYDPLFLKFSLENGDYSPEQALEFSRRATPTLSRMANEGITFTNAFASSNLCAPSRIAIATGIQPNKWGIYRNIDCEARGPNPGSLLVENLHNAGYATAHIGKWHIGSRDKSTSEPGSCLPEHHALNNGFDYYYGYNTWQSPFYNADNIWEGFTHLPPNPTYNTDLFTDLALNFIDKSIKEDKPFYVQLFYHAVHGPLDPKAPDQYYDKFDSESFNLNNFYAHVLAVDENVRKLEAYLKDKGIDENTMIVFTSDNGGSIGERSTLPGNAPYRGHKGMYLMGGIKVPLFFYWPDGIKTPSKNKQLVSGLDILPTILDATGNMPPENIDGKSLLSYLKNNSEEAVHDYLIWSGIHATTWGFMKQNDVYSENPSRNGAPFAWVVIKDNFALRFIAETIPGLYKDKIEGLPSYYELYNIDVDPGERKDLLQENPGIFRDLKSIWEKESGNYPPPVTSEKVKWEQIVSVKEDLN